MPGPLAATPAPTPAAGRPRPKTSRPQIFRRIEDPEPSCVAPWKALPAWQQEVDADIFESIESVETLAD